MIRSYQAKANVKATPSLVCQYFVDRHYYNCSHSISQGLCFHFRIRFCIGVSGPLLVSLCPVLLLIYRLIYRSVRRLLVADSAVWRSQSQVENQQEHPMY